MRRACRVLTLPLILILWTANVHGNGFTYETSSKRRLSKRNVVIMEDECTLSTLSPCKQGDVFRDPYCVTLKSFDHVQRNRAGTICKKFDGSVLTINDLEESDLVTEYMRKTPFGQMWTSMNDQEIEGTFMDQLAPGWYNGSESQLVPEEVLEEIKIVRSKTPETHDCVKLNFHTGTFTEGDCGEKLYTYCSNPDDLRFEKFSETSGRSPVLRNWTTAYEFCGMPEEEYYPKGQNLFVVPPGQLDELQHRIKAFFAKVNSFWLGMRYKEEKWYIRHKDEEETEAKFQNFGPQHVNADSKPCAVVLFNGTWQAVACNARAMTLCLAIWEPKRPMEISFLYLPSSPSVGDKIQIKGTLISKHHDKDTTWTKFRKTGEVTDSVKIEEREKKGEWIYRDPFTMKSGECILSITKVANFIVSDQENLYFLFALQKYEGLTCTPDAHLNGECVEILIKTKAQLRKKAGHNDTVGGDVYRPPGFQGNDGKGTKVHGAPDPPGIGGEPDGGVGGPDEAGGLKDPPTVELWPGLGPASGALWADDNVKMRCKAAQGETISWVKYRNGKAKVLDPTSPLINSWETNVDGKTIKHSSLTTTMTAAEVGSRYSCFTKDPHASGNSSLPCAEGEEGCTNFPTLVEPKGEVTMDVERKEGNNSWVAKCSVKFSPEYGGKLVWYWLEDPDCSSAPVLLPNEYIDVDIQSKYDQNKSVLSSTLTYDIDSEYNEDSFRCYSFELSLNPGVCGPTEALLDGNDDTAITTIVGLFLILLLLAILCSVLLRIKTRENEKQETEDQRINPEGFSLQYDGAVQEHRSTYFLNKMDPEKSHAGEDPSEDVPTQGSPKAQLS